MYREFSISPLIGSILTLVNSGELLWLVIIFDFLVDKQKTLEYNILKGVTVRVTVIKLFRECAVW